MKTLRRVLCVFALLMLASIGLIACSQGAAKSEADAVMACAEAPVVQACVEGVAKECGTGKCTPRELAAKSLQCVVDCLNLGSGASAAGAGGSDAG